jgi:NTE family protein
LAHTPRWTLLVHPSVNRHALLDTTRLAAVACELTIGATVVLRDGAVSSAVLASAPVPACSPPRATRRAAARRPGLVDPVPATLARTLGADIVVAVDVSGPLPHPPIGPGPDRRRGRVVPPRGLQVTGRRHDLQQRLPAVDEYAFGELSRIPESEQAGQTAAEQALPLLRALIAAAQARRDWQHASSHRSAPR